MTTSVRTERPGKDTDPDEGYAEFIAGFRDRLIGHRRSQGITHPQLAKLMNMHLGRAIAAEECDPKQWRMLTLLRYADAIGVDLVIDFKPRP